MKTLLLGALAMHSLIGAAAPASGTSTTAGAVAAVRIDAAKPGAVINRNVYGQFAEHLGTGIYGGLWVGPDSPIPNTRGWRNDVVAALKRLRVPLVRWPGGCFADDYHWRDGIGPRAQRPVRVNSVWGGAVEDNAVGTHEFFDLVEQLGATAYVNANMGSGTVREMADWLEYMTADSNSTLAQERRRNGRDKPFAVTHFGIGNEAWGCGGHMEPETYAALYRQYATFLRTRPEVRPKLVASGGNDDDIRWTEVLSKNIRHNVDAISFHYYAFPSGKFHGKGAATGFAEAEWFSTLYNAQRIGQLIDNNLAVLERNDPGRKVAFYVDEWGTWYDDEPGVGAALLQQPNTLRDALVAALSFNAFHARAERVQMTSIAQMVNVLQAMVLTDGARMALTPTFHAFEMYVPFQGATVLPLTLQGAPAYTQGERSMPAVSASAARDASGRIHVALVNTLPRQDLPLTLAISGAKAGRAQGRLLSAATLDARNTYDAPRAVQPVAFNAAVRDGVLSLTLPAKSVLVLSLEP